MVNKAAVFAKASNKLDTTVKALAKQVETDKDASADLKKSAKAALTPVQHRETLRKVSQALGNLASQSNKVEQSKLNQKDGGDGDTKGDDGKAAGGGSAGAIIGAIVGVLVVVGGVAYCKC